MRSKRKYALFARPWGAPKGTKWTRMSSLALFKQSAASVFQGSLLSGPERGLRMELRVAEPIEPLSLPVMEERIKQASAAASKFTPVVGT